MEFLEEGKRKQKFKGRIAETKKKIVNISLSLIRMT